MAYGKQLSADTVVKVGFGKLYSITISSTSSGTFAVYDGISASGVKLIDTTTPAAADTYFFPEGMQFDDGLFIDIGNTISMTVTFE